MIRELLPRVSRGERLTREEARSAVRSMVSGTAPDEDVAAFLAALARRGETGEEILGGAEALRAEAVPFPASRGPLLDTCGTGGDNAQTFNISTAVALVAAAAGVPVAKHGNRSVSSRSGSADVLEALGARIDLSPTTAARSLEESGFTFLNARVFHPAMRHVARARASLGIRTLFNWLGPLANPAHAEHQLLGVADRSRVGMVAHVLGHLGSRRAFVVHGAGGLDELALEAGNVVWEATPAGAAEIAPLEARSLGLRAAPAGDLKGGDPAENARLLRDLLRGERGPRRDAVVLNAAAALMVAGTAASFTDGAALAAEQLDSGRALATLDRFVSLSRRLAAEERA